MNSLVVFFHDLLSRNFLELKFSETKTVFSHHDLDVEWNYESIWALRLSIIPFNTIYRKSFQWNLLW